MKMNDYVMAIEGLREELTMEFLSEHLPNNVNKMGFICCGCGSALMSASKELCDECAPSKSKMVHPTHYILGFTIPVELDNYNIELDEAVVDVNSKPVWIGISSKNVDIYDNIKETLVAVYKDDNGIYSFKK